MWKVMKWSLTALWTLILGFAVFIFQTWISGKPLPNLPRFIIVFSSYKSYFILGLLILGIVAVMSFQKDALRSLENKVRFYKSTSRVKPFDINPNKKWYDPFLIECPIVDKVVNMLAGGHGVVLLGVPLIGKTRYAYEALRRLRGYRVLGLKASTQDISEIKIPAFNLFWKPKLILFLDDLQNYIGQFYPPDLLTHLCKQSQSINILATCRSGEEFALLQRNQSFRAFVNQYLQKVHVEEMSKDEEKILADHFGRPWNETLYNGTPGSIVFGLDEMLCRLRLSSKEARNLMRSLYLMNKAGIRTYQRGLVERVAAKIYPLHINRLGTENAWRWLQEAGFLTAGIDSVLPTHPVYLESSFCPDYEFSDTAGYLADMQQIVVDSSERRAIADIALTAVEHGDEQMAERGFRRCLELVPNEAAMHSNLGTLLSEQGRLDEGEVELREAIRCDADFTLAHSNLALFLTEQGRVDEAEAEYREAIRCAPDFALVHFNLAGLLSEQGRKDEAEAGYREAIRCDPNFARARFNLALLLINQERMGEAEAECRAALSSDPHDAEAHVTLGLVLAGQGLMPDAKEQFSKALHYDSSLAVAHYSLGSLLAEQGEKAEAEKHLRECLRYKPHDTAAHFGLGLLLAKQGRVAEAEAEYREVIRYDPNDADPHANLGLLLAKQGREDEAEAEYREAIRCDPNDALAQSNLGESLIKKGRVAEGEKHIHEALRSDPEDAAAHSNLGLLRARQGRTDEAEAEYREAISCDPNNAAAHFNLGLLLEKRGQITEAQEHFREAHRIGGTAE